MQLSCNLIKRGNALIGGDKRIKTRYSTGNEEVEEEVCVTMDFEMEEMIKQYEQLAANILVKSRSDAEKILIESQEKAALIEKKAYEMGYDQGKSNGYEDGYNEGYNRAIIDSEEKVNAIINSANTILCTASDDYKAYMDKKREEIISLAFEMAKVITKKEFEKSESILKLIEPAIESYKGEESLIIRCNTQYVEIIKSKLELWKNTYNLKGEIFILEDLLMDNGNAIVENKTGKIQVGMDIALEKLEEVVKVQIAGGYDD